MNRKEPFSDVRGVVAKFSVGLEIKVCILRKECTERALTSTV